MAGGQAESLLVRFPTAVAASGINIDEIHPNHLGGVSLMKAVILVEADGTQHALPIAFVDRTLYGRPLALRWPQTPCLVKGVLISTQDADFEEIDVVGLLSDPRDRG